MKRIILFIFVLMLSGCGVLNNFETQKTDKVQKKEQIVTYKERVVYKSKIESIDVSLEKDNLKAGDKMVFVITVNSNNVEQPFHLPFELALFKEDKRLVKIKKNMIIDKKVKKTTISLPVKGGLNGKYDYEFTFLKYIGVKKEGFFNVN